MFANLFGGKPEYDEDDFKYDDDDLKKYGYDPDEAEEADDIPDDVKEVMNVKETSDEKAMEDALNEDLLNGMLGDKLDDEETDNAQPFLKDDVADEDVNELDDGEGTKPGLMDLEDDPLDDDHVKLMNEARADLKQLMGREPTDQEL